MHYFELNGIINLDIRLIDTGEIAIATPKVKEAQTLRQKDRIRTKLWKAIKFAPKKKNLSGTKTERMNFHALFFVRKNRN